MREAAPTLYDQLDAAYSSGFREGTGFLPVADLNPVRISLAAVTTKLDWHPFYVTLSRHPSGMYGVEIASFYGMTLGAPILFSGDGHRNSSSVNPRGEAISLAAKPTRFSNMMRDFDGNQVDLLG